MIRYRFNFVLQFTFGSAAFLFTLVLTEITFPSTTQITGALLIGVAAYIISGYRYRRPIKNVYILLGHPDRGSEHAKPLADAYEQGARDGGFNVVRQNLYDLEFDEALHHGYREIQDLEPDLREVQDNIKWADHIVVIYPNWWSTMPAKFKGVFDRLWLPGFAFHFNKYTWKKLLKGRTGRVILTLDNFSIIAHLFFGDYTNEIQNAILEFAGIHPTDVTEIDGIKFRSNKWFERQKEKVYRMGRKAL